MSFKCSEFQWFALFTEIELSCSSESSQREKAEQEGGRFTREGIEPPSYALQVSLQPIQGSSMSPTPGHCPSNIFFKHWPRFLKLLYAKREKNMWKYALRGNVLIVFCAVNKKPFHVLCSCGICKKNQDQHLLLLCDTCKLHYHLGCLDPPLTRMPKKTKNSYWWEQEWEMEIKMW